ncbi:MAG TPA: hypothetical protein VG963_19245, partial [Polyangiaceae bacterium]|nr:hypothetical protein [Polyangiaceae bacterium]
MLHSPGPFVPALIWSLCAALVATSSRVLAAPLPPPAAATSPASATTAASAPASGLAESLAATLQAYHAALADKRLDEGTPLSAERLRTVLESAEAQLGMGRRDEAVALLAAVVESPRFAPLRELEEGRAVVFTLGDTLGRVGAYPLARAYLVQLLAPGHVDTWYRRAVSSLVDFGLTSGDPDGFLNAVSNLAPGADEPWAGDVAYLNGVLQERSGRHAEALAAYALVTPRSRFWAQATYRSGLIEVEQRRFAEGEQQFCKVADPKQTPKLAPLFGGNAFFEIRDLSRLALGRVAHEQYRF